MTKFFIKNNFLLTVIIVFYFESSFAGMADGNSSSMDIENSNPYKDGAYYTGKEHVWDEGFGYWGAAAHALTLTAEQNYNVAKKKDMASADFNNDGVVDLKNEYTFAHAYYASSYDKGGKTNYLETVTKAFVDGRKLIASANGENLTDSER